MNITRTRKKTGDRERTIKKWTDSTQTDQWTSWLISGAGDCLIFPALCANALYVFWFLTEFVAATTFHIFCTYQYMALKAHVSLVEAQIIVFTPLTVVQVICTP